MNPILITTPRTCSTLITSIIHNISKQYFGSKNNLNEFFNFSHYYKSKYERIDDVITMTEYIIGNKRWFINQRENRLSRLAMLKDDYNYTIKVFPVDLEKEIIDTINNHFDIVYLERRNKLNLLMSFFVLEETNISHYDMHSSAVIKTIKYDRVTALQIIFLLKQFAILKQKYHSKFETLYYEDFMSHEDKDEYIIQKLGLTRDSSYIPYVPHTKPTPYVDNDLESLIQNKEEWIADKESILFLLDAVDK